MRPDHVELPLIDLSRYLNNPTDQERDHAVAQVRDACSKFGFFQLKGHGVLVEQQRGLLRGMDYYFNLPREEKMKNSFLKNTCRRGYEASGDSLRPGDAMADAKESFYMGREDKEVEHFGFYGPNNWPDLPKDQFQDLVWDYYQACGKLGRAVWEILLLGLGHSTKPMENFAKKPVVALKLLRYPAPAKTLDGQFGVGAHTDFGGVTLLLQQPGKDGLEVWLEDRQEWLDVPALEDVLVINCGDMIQKWSGGAYKSVRHRVVNKADGQRLSAAMFWHGDVMATNPLNPDDPDKTTVGQLWMKKFKNQMSVPAKAAEAFASPS